MLCAERLPLRLDSEVMEAGPGACTTSASSRHSMPAPVPTPAAAAAATPPAPAPEPPVAPPPVPGRILLAGMPRADTEAALERAGRVALRAPREGAVGLTRRAVCEAGGWLKLADCCMRALRMARQAGRHARNRETCT